MKLTEVQLNEFKKRLSGGSLRSMGLEKKQYISSDGTYTYNRFQLINEGQLEELKLLTKSLDVKLSITSANGSKELKKIA